jgi:tetratricopeptide (TPR) repeat protein
VLSRYKNINCLLTNTIIFDINIISHLIKMRNYLTILIDKAIALILLLVAGVTPILFLNKTTEFYDMPKFIFLIAATILLLGLTIFSWILKGKVIINRTPLDVPLLVFLVIVIVSTIFSATRYQAIYGDLPSIHGSAASWILYILLYFVTVSNLKDMNRIKNFLYVFYASATVVALATLLSFFGVFLPLDFAKGFNFTPTGSTFSTIALLMLLLPLPLVSIINPNQYLPRYMAVILSVLFSIVIALTGSIPTYVVLLIVFGISLYISKDHLSKVGLTLFIASAAAVILTLILAYMPFAGNKIQQLEAGFPKEIQLPLAISWKISASSFRDAPFFGTGPASYLFNFTSYKPTEFNLLKYWNFSFSTAHDEFLQILSTLGLLGFFTLIAICVVVIKNSNKYISLTQFRNFKDIPHETIQFALAISGLTSIILLLIHAATLVSIVATLFILAALMMSQESIRNKTTELSMGLKAATTQNQQFDLLPVVIFIVFLVGAVTLLSRTYTIVSADYYHRLALSQATKNGTLTYQHLQKAESLNPTVDSYRVDMAQTNFALANTIAIQKGPTKDKPQGSLTDKDKQTIQTLLSQAINEGRASVLLNPRSSRNWEILASIYRNITGVANNALTFSLDAYGKAIQRDPMNPALRFAVGEVYFANKNYDTAIRFFTDAVNLKPDYTNAYFDLALAYREKGDFKNAQLIAEHSLTLIKKETSPKDYKIVSDLITDLKAKNVSKQNESETGLKNKDLSGVDVSTLNNPPKVSTPSAVKKNPQVKLPATNISITPTATP